MNQRDMGRRDFMKTLGLAGTAALLAGRARAADEAGKAPAASQKVPTRPFGKAGVNVASLALGGAFGVPCNALLLDLALKHGVTYWDTADCYGNGNSELGLGQFFEKFPAARKQVFLVTKGHLGALPDQLSRSLERMKTDAVDLYLVHGLGSSRELTPEVKAWVEKAKQAGKIRLFGFSTHGNMEECLKGAAEAGWVDGIMLTYNYRLMQSDAMRAAVDAAAKAGIGLLAMKSQGGGPVKTDSEAELKLAGHFLAKGYTSQQAKLKALWDNPAIASICVAMGSTTVLLANVAAATDRTALTAADHAQLRAHAAATCAGYCAGCAAICAAATGGRAPVADVMRHLMYYRHYGEPEEARAQFARLPADVRSRLAALDYAEAERRCPQRLAVGRLMREATTLLA